MYDNGDSFGAASDADKAANSGYTVSMEYGMGNITLGAGYSSSRNNYEVLELLAAATTAVAAAGNVYEDNITMFGVGYDMGGGVNTFFNINNGSIQTVTMLLY